MSKKLLSIICSAGFILCVFTGCTSDAAEDVIQALRLSSFIESGSDDSKAKQPQDFENREPFNAYYSAMTEIIGKHREQTRMFPASNPRIQAILDALSKEYIAELKEEYNGISARYQSLVQSFYADGHYIALKNELSWKISELDGLTKGSPKYNLTLAQINAIWGQISMLAGEVNSEITTLGIMANELSKEIQSLINADEGIIISLIESAVAPSSGLSNAFWRELRLLQKALGLPQAASEQDATI